MCIIQMQNSRQRQVDIETQKLFRQNTIYNSFRFKKAILLVGNRRNLSFAVDLTIAAITG